MGLYRLLADIDWASRDDEDDNYGGRLSSDIKILGWETSVRRHERLLKREWVTRQPFGSSWCYQVTPQGKAALHDFYIFKVLSRLPSIV